MLQQRNEICHGKVLGKWSCDGENSTPNIHLVKGKHRDLGVSSSNTRKYNRIIIEQIIWNSSIIGYILAYIYIHITNTMIIGS
jgi:hypothetical protein